MLMDKAGGCVSGKEVVSGSEEVRLSVGT
jgi:hypothetical protein